MKGRPGQSGPLLKFFCFSKIDWVESELKLLMIEANFSARRRDVSLTKKHCTSTASLLIRFACHNRTYRYQKFDDFFQVVAKILIFQGTPLSLAKKSIDYLLNNIKNFSMLFGNFVFSMIKDFNRMINRKTIFYEKRKWTFYFYYLQQIPAHD